MTTTLNPLHFEDLEPHRFEDLVRQLAYDFRSWERIEAVGRAGSDEGADIIAVEALREFGSSSEDGDLGDRGRLWVIQCKARKNDSTQTSSYLCEKVAIWQEQCSRVSSRRGLRLLC